VDEVILLEEEWRHVLGLKPERTADTRVNIGCLNAVPNIAGGLHRWLHRGDLLRLLYKEAERLESADLKVLADRINEATRKESP